MKLTYPRTKSDWEHWRNREFPEIPNVMNRSSGYKGIGIAESNSDIYVLISNMEETELWMEKVSKLKARSPIYFEDLAVIVNEEERRMIHNFFIKKGILDGTEG